MSKLYTADFETTTNSDDCRVWAYALMEIGNTNNFIYGNSIEDFIKWCSNPKVNYKLYFHNLKFDSEFIFNYLLNNGFICIKNKKDRKDKTFTCLISDTGQFYSLEIYFKVCKKDVNKVSIYDSLKILNMSVDKIAKGFNLPIRKLELDYNKYREVGHELTTDEIDYIKNDVGIMAMALEIMFKQGLNKMTIGSNALTNYKSFNTRFKQLFPIQPYEIDMDIRKSYKGGFTYLNPIYKEKDVFNGIVLDVNSLYPSVMKNDILPFGNPIFFKGEYKKDVLHPLYIQTLSCIFEIKDGFIPTIQIKNSLSFLPNEYLESSKGDIVTLTLTNIDLELFKKHYNIYNLIYHSGWKFRGMRGMFNEYINYWSTKKIESKKEGNSALYQISKLMLNSLYGKFGLNPNVRGKYPVLEDDVVKYKMYDRDIRDSIYLPIATFITSYARLKTISTSQKIRDYSIKNYDRDYYIYSDTDSIHMISMNSNELCKIIDVDDYKLGAWKLESSFVKARFIRQKCYIEQSIDGVINTTIAGLPTYYPEHMKKLGYHKETGWVEYRLTLPEAPSERHRSIAEAVKARYGLKVRKLTKRQVKKEGYGQKIFKLINETYCVLYGYSLLSEKQIDQYVDAYLGIVNMELLSFVEDSDGNLIAAALTIPSMAEALQKCNGELLPFGWWHLLKSMYWKRPDTLDLLLIGVRPDYQNKGVNSLVMVDLLERYHKLGFKYAETNANLESNIKIQAMWDHFEHELHKRRWIFAKEI